MEKVDRVDAVVIGAGVVGLACARALARRGMDVIILERQVSFGSGISSRNSEVIHAGIYYSHGSLKARLCVEGRRMLYQYCADRGIGHHKCGKLIVSTDSVQDVELQRISQHAEANEVEGMRMLSRCEVRAFEPELVCTSALMSSETGIVDSHGLMLALLGDAEYSGAVLATHSTVTGGNCNQYGITLRVVSGGDMRLQARYVVNSTGLDAWEVAGSLEGFSTEHLPVRHFAKGSYFSLASRSPFSHLVYPVPEPGGLGVHLTLDLAGQARFGPDVEWVAEPHYEVQFERAEGFYGAIRKYWPGLRDGQLLPAYAGVRPKISGPKDSAADFLIQGPIDHGINGLVNLFGIESPGLTSSLALAEFVCEKLGVS